MTEAQLPMYKRGELVDQVLFLLSAAVPEALYSSCF